VPGKTICLSGPTPARFALRSACASVVSQEVLAPSWVARSLSYPNQLDTVG